MFTKFPCNCFYRKAATALQEILERFQQFAEVANSRLFIKSILGCGCGKGHARVHLG